MFCGSGVKVSLESHTKKKKGSTFLFYHLQIKLIPASGDAHSRSVSHQAPLHFLIFVKPKTIIALQVCLLDATETKVKRKSEETFNVFLQTCRDDCR